MDRRRLPFQGGLTCGYWVSGTVVGAEKDARGSTVHHYKFLDIELKWETEIYSLSNVSTS